jgi:peptide/nickel transport system substrate-binding protein
MKSKNLILLVAVLVLGVVAWWFIGKPGGDHATAHRDVDLVVGTETDITTLDPIKTLDPHVIRIIGQVYEGLVGLDESNQLVPKLAESWQPNDRFDRWKFKLRKGVAFHQNSLFGASGRREVDAEDVIFSLNRIAGKNSMSAFLVGGVIKQAAPAAGSDAPGPLAITAISPSEIEIELVSPDPFFVHRLSATPLVVVPKEIAQLPDGDFGTKTIIGTGPFAVVSRSDSEVVLKRNDSYWAKPDGNVSRLVFRTIKNDQIRLQELSNGQIQLARIPSATAEGVLEKGTSSLQLKPSWGGFDFKVFRTFNTVVLGLNCEKLDLPFRRALSLGIQRTDLVKLVPNGLAEVAPGPIPFAIPGYQSKFTTDIFDAEKAKALLAESKLPKQIEILVHEKDASEPLGQIIQAQFKQIGVETTLTKLDYNAVIGRMVSGNYAGFIMGFEFTFPAPAPIAEMLFSPAKIPVPNFWRYNNPQVAALLQEYTKTSDPAATARITTQIEEAVVNDPPGAFLLQNKTLIVYKKGISNLYLNGQSVPLLWKVTVK